VKLKLEVETAGNKALVYVKKPLMNNPNNWNRRAKELLIKSPSSDYFPA